MGKWGPKKSRFKKKGTRAGTGVGLRRRQKGVEAFWTTRNLASRAKKCTLREMLRGGRGQICTGSETPNQTKNPNPRQNVGSNLLMRYVSGKGTEAIQGAPTQNGRKSKVRRTMEPKRGRT